jgi:hypothetical protein
MRHVKNFVQKLNYIHIFFEAYSKSRLAEGGFFDDFGNFYHIKILNILNINNNCPNFCLICIDFSNTKKMLLIEVADECSILSEVGPQNREPGVPTAGRRPFYAARRCR